uniref:Uncharacterized protein MANES_14G130400 n=1 Tax=Rhizophora mucronata TaxID=61149 RepID=A0A2P2KKT3_RHIMU
MGFLQFTQQVALRKFSLRSLEFEHFGLCAVLCFPDGIEVEEMVLPFYNLHLCISFISNCFFAEKVIS